MSKKVKSIISMLLAVVLILGVMPIMSVSAAQKSDYEDPADNWLKTNSRTNELDINATVTNETQWCSVCQKETGVITYRVPEYTKSGETALNRGVKYSDGTMLDGENIGNLDSGTPGIDAYYTGYHFTKVVCQTCGTMNTFEGPSDYNFNNNVYALNPCDNLFYLDFDNTTYEEYDDQQHITTLKKGEYCQFCKGTYARATDKREPHNLETIVDGQVGNNRFYMEETCEDCGYEISEYVAAKMVVSSYYGNTDGKAHTVSLTDLSDGDVHTKIRYGTEADDCYLTSAPNYTDAGYYPVYYEVDYKFEGESMTENGVSYVWLLEDNSKEADDTTGAIVPHVHDYRYLETVKPTCVELGYERWQCSGCGSLLKQNYAQSLGHGYKSTIIREATCTRGGMGLEICTRCGDFHEITTAVAEHQYEEKDVPATCKSAGYTENVCKICGDLYVTNITGIVNHRYETIERKPDCVNEGYTTYICEMCHISFTDNRLEALGHAWDEGNNVTDSTCTAEGVMEYHCTNAGCDEKMIKATDATGHTPGLAATCTEPQVCTVCETVLELPTGHTYDAEITEPTCTAMGYTTYTCHCTSSYVADYTDVLPHNYSAVVTEPTCTSHGMTEYNCVNCNHSYVSNYVERLEHKYEAEVTEPTCTTMGYTTYVCQCGAMYKADYVDELPHDYVETVTESTCLELGYTTFVCHCGKNFKAEYKEAKGHSSSEWIIDVEATIDNAGTKHIECTVCGEVLSTAEIPQLIDKDHSDEDGNAKIGDYSLILTDKDGKPVFDSEITIDINDNVTIKLPKGKLLDYADQTTITAIYTDTQEAKTDLQIFIYDENNNAAIGKTDANGQLKVPNSQSSTGDDNGTIGKDDGEAKTTFVVTVTDKTNAIIPNCDVYIGESNNLVVDLPEGIKPTREYPVIITVADQNGNAQKDVTVITLGDADYIEKGVTDIYGKVTLPITNEGYTDENGKVNVNAVNVIVNDELGVIPDAYVIHNEDESISVTLPEDKSISYANRITVTVLDSMGNPIKDRNVTVKDIDEKSYTALTDENGRIVVPPLSEDMTDNEGKAKVNGYNIIITDEQKPIENAFVYIKDKKIYVTLPEDVAFDFSNRITAAITNEENAPVKDMSVTFTDNAGKSETNLTDETGKATVPPTYIDYTDVSGYSEVDGFNVTVTNETGAIEKAQIVHHIEAKNEDGTILTPEDITVTLPENVEFDYANRVTVKVLNKANNTAVKDMLIKITEAPLTDTEPKSLEGKTNAEGKAVFPPLNEDVTDDKGDSGVTEEVPGEGEDTDGDGTEDKPGEIVVTSYIVKVNDTKGIIADAFIELKDGKVIVTLPETHTLTTSNQTTVTVLDKDNNPVKEVSVTVKDATTEKTATTNSNGQITVPVKSSGGGGGSSRPSGGGGGGGSSIGLSTVNIKVTDKDGKTVSVSKSTTTDKATITLPLGKNLHKDNNYYTITVTDRNGKGKADYTVVLKDRDKNEVTGKTNANGTVTLPAKEHKAYIVGYDDGTFRPDSDMTRAEAAAIFARLISEEKGEKISGSTSFKDVDKNEWYAAYIGYLAKYNIIKGYSDKTFRPEDSVTRAEFVTMSVRYYGLFNDVKNTGYTVKYTDINKNYWAYNDIALAKNIGWLNGYADGTFRGDNNITRAEVVTVVNRATGRLADKEFVNENLTKLNRFTDLKNNAHWAFYDAIEASNTHMAVTTDGVETWVD